MKHLRIFSGILCLLAVGLLAPRSQAAPRSTTPANGIELTPLTTFYTNNGANPYDAPVFGPDGNLYGTTYNGGSNNVGVIFKVTLSGSNITLHTFGTNFSSGENPAASLIVGQDGWLYGVTSAGGTNGAGTIFRVTTNGTFNQLYSFGMQTNSAGYDLDGSTPYGALVQGRDGFFYGTTYVGGTSNLGTVFQFSANGTLNTLYSFSGNDGANPYESQLVEGADGIFYGAAYTGGYTNDGTIFQITSGGALTTLWQFSGTNGQGPYNGLNFGQDGNLYGTTIQGGTNFSGTIFQITTNGDFTLLYQFPSPAGYYPEGGAVPGFNDILYGTTSQGGANGYGTIFQLTTNGVFTTIYTFTNGNDGSVPAAGVIRDANGYLYGTVNSGGKKGGNGVVYRWADLFNPTNTITAPVANQRWSNEVFTVTGTAKDNVAVCEVFYSLNGAGWVMPVSTNNWTNWSVQAVLTPGTNTVQAFAVDGNGHFSTTNTVKFIYVPGFSTAILTVRTNGAGTISPGYNNSLLLIGTNYSMTAKADTGSVFTNWTDGSNNVVSSTATLTFTMNSNLTLVANFNDFTAPTVTITTPKTGSRWTNTTFTVTGKATDNMGISNVFCSVNGGAWTNATLSNANSNWTAQVSLTAGTNTIAAYAVDTSGNLSPTNSVKLDQIPGAVLTVQIVGQGILTPNYNNALLALGNTYSMKAVGNNGFSFYYWKSGSLMTSNSTLSFVMTTNLTNTCNFKDVEPPTIEITYPTNKLSYSNSFITAVGQAYDNSLDLAGVEFQMNGGPWMTANPNNGLFYVWTTTNLPVKVGANVFAAYSIDGAGNFSRTNTVTFTGVVPPDWAVDTMSNVLMTASGRTNDFDLSCSASTFSLLNHDVAGESGIGIYSYDKTATNMATLELTNIAPANVTNSDINPQTNQLTFTSVAAGTFTNLTTTDTGTFAMTTALPYPPKGFSGHTFTATQAGTTNITTFKFSTASVTITQPGSTNTGSYVVDRPSPPAAFFTITNASNIYYLQVNFTSLSGGGYEFNTYDSGGVNTTNELGSFNMK